MGTLSYDIHTEGVAKGAAMQLNKMHHWSGISGDDVFVYTTG